MEQLPSSEAIEDIPTTLLQTNAHYHVHKTPLLVPVLNTLTLRLLMSYIYIYIYIYIYDISSLKVNTVGASRLRVNTLKSFLLS